MVFEQLGVPSSDRPVALALSATHAWALFEPARLVRIERHGETVRAKTWVGAPGSRWTALDVDPVDGSIWVGTRPFGLVRVRPNGDLENLSLRGASGEGQFAALAVAPDAIYAQPEIADDGIWRFERSGRLIGTAFPRAPLLEDNDKAVALDESPSAGIRLERGAHGEIWFWDMTARKLYQADETGSWNEISGALFEDLPVGGRTFTGLNLGTRRERWYFNGRTGSLFFWQGRPMFLGHSTFGGRGGQETVVIERQGSGYREVLEECAGHTLEAIQADANGYAALADVGLILGDHSTSEE